MTIKDEDLEYYEEERLRAKAVLAKINYILYELRGRKKREDP